MLINTCIQFYVHYNFKFLLKYAYTYTHYIYNNYTDERGWIDERGWTHTKILSVVISEYWYDCFPFCFSVFCFPSNIAYNLRM